MIESELVDTTVKYAEASDVSSYLRGYEFDAASDPTLTELEGMLLDTSEYIDTYTRRAWRTRKVSDYVLEVELSEAQDSLAYPTGWHMRNNRHWREELPARRGIAWLPHADIKQIDPTLGDSVEVLKIDSVEDITPNEGRDSDYVVDYRGGILEPSLQAIGYSRGTRTHMQATGDELRVTYRYGRGSIPGDIKRACAKLVAADLIETDTYGEILPEGGLSNSPSQSDAATRLRDEAMSVLNQYRRDLMVV